MIACCCRELLALRTIWHPNITSRSHFRPQLLCLRTSASDFWLQLVIRTLLVRKTSGHYFLYELLTYLISCLVLALWHYKNCIIKMFAQHTPLISFIIFIYILEITYSFHIYFYIIFISIVIFIQTTSPNVRGSFGLSFIFLNLKFYLEIQ